jgi:hypothetical protein
VDDLVLTAESREGVTDKFNGWKVGIEKRGLKINMDKTMVMVTGKEARENIQSGRWPCGSCGGGVNLILFVACDRLSQEVLRTKEVAGSKKLCMHRLCEENGERERRITA